MNTNHELSVLLIDDDDVACESVIRSFKKYNLPMKIVAAHDGMEALDILHNKHPDKSIERPFITLLDLNMPRMNGFEFLEVVRDDEELKSVVIFVLTTSDDHNDRIRAYQKQIAGYMVKSEVGPQFSKLANLLTEYNQTINLPIAL